MADRNGRALTAGTPAESSVFAHWAASPSTADAQNVTLSGMRTALNSQPANANLTALAGLTGLADRLAYFTGAGAMVLATFTAFGRSLVAAADAAAARTLTGAAPAATPIFTGLTTVAGVKVASGAVSAATLTEAAHGGGVFTCSGAITCPNAAGFSVTLIATAAATVRVAAGATTSLATGDVLSVFIPAVGTARAVKTLAADVITMPVA